MSTRRIDALVAGLASVRDAELVGEARSPRAQSLLAAIVDTPVERREPSRRGRVLAVAAAVGLAALLTLPALGIGRGVTSFLAGPEGDVDPPRPTGPRVVVAAGVAGVPWQIESTTSDEGLCLGLLVGDANGLVCGYQDLHGDLLPDVRGNPAQRCLASPTEVVPCGSLPRRWLSFVSTGQNFGLDRVLAYGLVAEGVARVELELDDGTRVATRLVAVPELGAPIRFYLAAWPCDGPCNVEGDPEAIAATAWDAEGRILERRVRPWNGNPTGDPDLPIGPDDAAP